MRRVASGFSPVITLDRRNGKPLHKQVYEAFCAAIVGRNLRAGQKVPSSRSLAVELKISRIPILTAYSQLHAEGYFETRSGSGTFVSSSLPDQWISLEGRRAALPPVRSARRLLSKRSALIPSFKTVPWLNKWGAFIVGQLAFEHFPFQVWASLVNRHVRNVRVNSLHYSDPMGSQSFRFAIAEYLRTTRAVNCEASQIMIVSGTQQALELTARVLFDPGDKIWIEEPGYRLARNAFALAGCRLIPVPVDEEGLDVAGGIARSRKARAAFVTPSHQFPLGHTLSLERRLQLLDWARRSRAYIVEDDYDSDFRHHRAPLMALKGLDREGSVIYLGTFSKAIGAGLRIGYMVLPSELVRPAISIKALFDNGNSWLDQAVLAEFIASGAYETHLRRIRRIYLGLVHK